MNVDLVIQLRTLTRPFKFNLAISVNQSTWRWTATSFNHDGSLWNSSSKTL